MSNREAKREVAVKLSGVKKMYKLGQIGGGTLTADLQSWWARVRGKEDPNTMIGTDQRLVGKTFMALNGIDLTIHKGEALGIIGSNGAGKSTMLKLLSRVTAPTEGEIDIYGRIASMLEVGTGFNGEMTGRENVYLNGAILGMTKAEIDAKMEDIIEFSEVRDFIDTPVKRYSSGMYVKLAFAVAAHLDSEIMIMDEVLAVGDMAFQKKCLNKMRDAAKLEGRTVLYVSHNMNTIRRLCDRCIVLDKGEIIFDGDVERAIEVYMGTSFNRATYRDYTSFKRENTHANFPIKTLLAEYMNKESCEFSKKEPIKLHLKWLNLRNNASYGFRFEVKAAGSTAAGTSIVYEQFNGEKDTVMEAVFTFDVSNLVPGNYTTYYTFFGQNDLTCTSIDMDCIPGLNFEILSEDGDMEWNTTAWGSILLQKPSVEVL